MATTPSPAVPVPINHLGRLAGVFFSPKETFAEIVYRPTWIFPVCVMVVIWLALNVVLVRRVDWTEQARKQIEKNRFAAAQIERLAPEQREQAYEQGGQRAKWGRYVRGVIGWPLLVVIVAAIYLGVFKIFGAGDLNFNASMAITAYGCLPLALRELLGILVVSFQDPTAIDPENFLPSNIGALLASTAPLWLIALGASLDLFAIWSLVLRAIGYSLVDPKKISFGKSFGVVFGLYAIIVLIFTGIAAIFS